MLTQLNQVVPASIVRSKDCKKELITCYKCGKRGHLQEFCHQISSYSRDDRRENKNSYDRHQHNSKENPKPINKNTEVHQKSKRGTKNTSHLRRTKNTRQSKFHARLADSNEDDEPMLQCRPATHFRLLRSISRLSWNCDMPLVCVLPTHIIYLPRVSHMTPMATQE